MGEVANSSLKCKDKKKSRYKRNSGNCIRPVPVCSWLL